MPFWHGRRKTSTIVAMDFKQISYFVQVAELGSFTRAASVLRVAQPALSRQVRSLEVELRQPLFERNGRGVTLTPAGQRLLDHGRGILQQVQRARQDLQAQRGAASGLLCIGLPPSVSRTLTAPLVEMFQRRFPAAQVQVMEALSTHLLEWLVQGRVDCAVVYNATPTAAVLLRPVLQERLYLVSARAAWVARAAQAARVGPGAEPNGGPDVGPPITLAELATQPLVMPGRPHAIRMQLETALAQAGLLPRVALEIDSVPAILELVQRQPLHALLSFNGIRSSGRATAFTARPVVVNHAGQPLATTLFVANAAQRPQGPLLAQAAQGLTALLLQQLVPAPGA
jgi:LysR family transcriptional regulator, nitrogen assimilation regulatory protein